MVQSKSIIFITVIWLAVILSGCVEEKNITAVPTPATPVITTTVTVTATSTPSVIVPEVTPTGNGTQIKLDSRRGFIPDIQTVRAGDEVVWDNFDTVTVTLMSNDGLFDAKSLAYYQRYGYIFNKPGTYTFSLENRESKWHYYRNTSGKPNTCAIDLCHLKKRYSLPCM
ncbi:MAG: cell surface lipoprotein [Candidatus Methanoperedens nitroreducens]|uniref:Cell surface lipoprotein n=1 Tax=Candidatus Methanoperedens nitratireducens TaxID=1392998 RepID=A0A0P8A9B6_9EURY|nr:MAG: cell surface lipoprotein [Candidatus Methanoperedens sp. BLZ1]